MPTLVVLAAGMGSRFGGLKQLEAIGPSGEFILDYSVYDALKAGFDKVVFVIRKEHADIFNEKVSSRYEGKIAIEYVHQELEDLPKGFSVPEGRTKPWGTGHAILLTKSCVQEPFAVINADDFYGRDSFMKLAQYLMAGDRKTSEHSLVAFQLDHTLSDHGMVNRGICEVDGDQLVNVMEHVHLQQVGDHAEGEAPGGEKRQVALDSPVSMNLWGFNPSIFEILEREFREFLTNNADPLKGEYFIPTVVDDSLKKGELSVHVLRSADRWFGVTYRDDLPFVQNELGQLIEKGVYSEKLWS